MKWIVGCVDLCSDNDIRGYPQIMLYNSGKLVEEFRGSRLLSNLKDFLHKNLPLSLPPSDSDLDEEQESLQSSTPTLDREGRVLSLTPSTFDYTVAKRTRIHQILRALVRTLQETGADMGKARRMDTSRLQKSTATTMGRCVRCTMLKAFRLCCLS